MTSRPPAYPSKAELAFELCMAESAVDELVRRNVLPPPYNGKFDWAEVERRINSIKTTPKGTIYVVGFGPYVKIGFTAIPLKFRLAGIQTGAPERLTVLAEIATIRTVERDLHRRFAPYRTHGEWFRREGALADWIDAGCAL